MSVFFFLKKKSISAIRAHEHMYEIYLRILMKRQMNA